MWINYNNSFNTAEIMNLYKNIFWDAPWNEWYICKKCSNIFPKNYTWSCCNKDTIEPFYKNNELKETLQTLKSKESYREIVASILDKPVWFIWWWNTNISELNTEKLSLNSNELDKLILESRRIFPNFDFQNFYYLAEIWVKTEQRWKDIAGNLYRKNLEEIKKWDVEYILVRTTKKTQKPYEWFKRDWFMDVYDYNDEQQRVILIKQL